MACAAGASCVLSLVLALLIALTQRVSEFLFTLEATLQAPL